MTQPFLEAFHVLAASRQYALGMSGLVPQALVLSEILGYGERYGWGETLETLDGFRYIIQHADGAWIEAKLKQIEKATKAK